MSFRRPINKIKSQMFMSGILKLFMNFDWSDDVQLNFNV